ncbi:MAG TPA: cupredoxin domain-containing protein [Longimicrobiaceae bacterium]
MKRPPCAAGAPAFVAALAILMPACGGSDADSRDMRVEGRAAMDTTPAGTPAPPSLPVLADDARRQTTVVLREWSLEPGADAVPAGEVTFQAMNTGGESHTLAIDGGGVDARTPPIGPGETATLTVALEPGTYRLFCPDGEGGATHASRGLSAPLVVR